MSAENKALSRKGKLVRLHFTLKMAAPGYFRPIRAVQTTKTRYFHAKKLLFVDRLYYGSGGCLHLERFYRGVSLWRD